MKSLPCLAVFPQLLLWAISAYRVHFLRINCSSIRPKVPLFLSLCLSTQVTIYISTSTFSSSHGLWVNTTSPPYASWITGKQFVVLQSSSWLTEDFQLRCSEHLLLPFSLLNRLGIAMLFSSRVPTFPFLWLGRRLVSISSSVLKWSSAKLKGRS